MLVIDLSNEQSMSAALEKAWERVIEHYKEEK